MSLDVRHLDEDETPEDVVADFMTSYANEISWRMWHSYCIRDLNGGRTHTFRQPDGKCFRVTIERVEDDAIAITFPEVGQ